MVQSSGANESKMEKHILWDFLLLLLFAGTNQVKNHMFGRSEEEPPAGRRKALSFLFDRVSSVTWEVKERKEAGGEKRETKTNREGKRERERESGKEAASWSFLLRLAVYLWLRSRPSCCWFKVRSLAGNQRQCLRKTPTQPPPPPPLRRQKRSGAEQSRAERNRMSLEQTGVSGSSTESHNGAVGPDWRCV